MNIPQVSVVLVRPQYPFNIGATARAMQNTGFQRLVLIAPACEIDVEARQGAASAQEVLARRETYNSLEEFYRNEGEGVRVAFTRREGLRRTLQPFQEFVKEELAPKISTEWANTPIYLMFGAEDDGLSASELEHAHRFCSLRTFGKNQSYNLAQAVLLTLFILQDSIALPEKTVPLTPAQPPQEIIEKWLEAVGFNLELSQKRSASITMNALLLRAVPNQDEMRIFTSILQQNIRKLNERKK